MAKKEKPLAVCGGIEPVWVSYEDMIKRKKKNVLRKRRREILKLLDDPAASDGEKAKLEEELKNEIEIKLLELKNGF